MLDRFHKAKRKEIRELRDAAAAGRLPIPQKGPNRGFADRLVRHEGRQPLAIIAEYKRASPSRGIICQSLEVEDVARQYCEAGANAMSILTEKDWFDGDLSFIDRAAAVLDGKLPLLRKDFIFNYLQIAATALTQAAAVLLIVRCLPNVSILREFREYAETFGLDCVVEVFDKRDLTLARDSGAKIIQVNARDLDTLKVSREACLELITMAKPESHEIWIAASGMEEAAHLRAAADAGYQAALIGSALMAGGTPGKNLKNLLQDVANAG